MKKINNKPLYYKIYDYFKEKIQLKKLLEGDVLPAERKLMDFFNVSRATVRQGLKKLENDGYIYIVHGSGAFVSHNTLKQELTNIYSFYEEMKKIGKHPTSKVLDFKVIDSDEKLNSIFKVSKNIKLINIIRLRLVDNEPIIFENTFLPLNKFKDFDPLLLNKKSMYSIFREQYNINLDKATESFSSLFVTNKQILSNLGYKDKASCMFIKRKTFSENDIVEYTLSYARGDKFEYKVTLNNL